MKEVFRRIFPQYPKPGLIKKLVYSALALIIFFIETWLMILDATDFYAHFGFRPMPGDPARMFTPLAPLGRKP